MRTTSPVRTRPLRTAAPLFPLTEEDDDQPSNQTTPDDAKPQLRYSSAEPSSDPEHSEEEHDEAIEDDESEASFNSMDDVQTYSTTPHGSPPPRLLESILDGTYIPAPALKPVAKSSTISASQLPVPKIFLPTASPSHTPRDSASTPAASAVPKLLDPEDDVLSESDLPEPWIEDAPSPAEAECEDRADYLLQKRFKPMADAQTAIATLTKISCVSTEHGEPLCVGREYTEDLKSLAGRVSHVGRKSKLARKNS